MTIEGLPTTTTGFLPTSTAGDLHPLTITGQPHLMVTEEAGTGAQVMDREDPGAQRDQEGLTRQEVPHIVGHQGQGEGGLAELLVATGIGIDLSSNLQQ